MTLPTYFQKRVRYGIDERCDDSRLEVFRADRRPRGASDLVIQHAQDIPHDEVVPSTTVPTQQRAEYNISQLEDLLRTYITERLRIRVTTFDDEGLCEKIQAAEKAYAKSKDTRWHRLWYKVGEKKEIAEPWLDLIPGEYGFGVLKAGVAVALNLAASSKEKRDRVFEVFETLRDALDKAHPDRAQFHDDPGVQKALEETREVVVKAVEDIVTVLSLSGGAFRAKLKSRKKESGESRPTLDSIQKSLENQIDRYRDALDQACRHSIQQSRHLNYFSAANILMVSNEVGDVKRTLHYGVENMTVVAEDVRHIKQTVDQNVLQHTEGLDEILRAVRDQRDQLQKLSETQQRLAEGHERLEEVNNLIHSIHHRFVNAQYGHPAITNTTEAGATHYLLPGTSQVMVISFADLVSILSEPCWAREHPHQLPSLHHNLQHPSLDLGDALAEQASLSVESQGQANRILWHPRFRDWLSGGYSDLLLIDANLPDQESAVLATLSAVSVFNAVLTTALTAAQSRNAALGCPAPLIVIAHFFCGLHASQHDAHDPWNGPAGMLRSLIVQLVSQLEALDDGSPEDFWGSLGLCLGGEIDHDSFLDGLEHHELGALCLTLHELLRGFAPGTQVFLVVDSISSFDVTRMLPDVRVILDMFCQIINDPDMPPIVKILLTCPGESSRGIWGMWVFRQDASRRILLEPYEGSPEELEEDLQHELMGFGGHPRKPAAGRRFDRSYYDYEHDGGGEDSFYRWQD